MTENALARQPTDRWFGFALTLSYALAGLILYSWAEFLEIFPGLGGLGRLVVPLFWAAHIAWLVSVIAVFKVFGRHRGNWALLGGLALLPWPAIPITLTVGCYVFGQCI